MSMYEVNGVLANIRDGTLDKFIVDEVIKKNTYRKLNILHEDIVLDLGMNIGMFTVWALKKGAKKVYGYEPEISNYNMATKNIKVNCPNADYQLSCTAVVGNDDKVRPLSINVKKNKGTHSLIEKRGRDTVMVDCVNINTVLQLVKPNVIKMDIEGGEYELIKCAENFNCVRELILEFHHGHLDDMKTHRKHGEIINILENNFNSVSYRPETKKSWVTIIHCTN